MDEPKTIRLVEDRWTVVRHAVEAIAIVAAGLWAIYVFVYQESIKPALEPPALQMTATFQPGAVSGGVRVAQLNVTLENTGHTETDVYGETIAVFGDRFELAAKRARGPDTIESGQVIDDRTVVTTPPELVYAYARLRDAAAGGLSGTHISLEPGERITLSWSIAVKEGRFDEMRAALEVAYGRFQPHRHHFSRIFLRRFPSGQVAIRFPRDKRIDDGDETDFTVQTTL